MSSSLEILLHEDDLDKLKVWVDVEEEDQASFIIIIRGSSLHDNNNKKKKRLEPP
jgi:hypothetical protein